MQYLNQTIEDNDIIIVDNGPGIQNNPIIEETLPEFSFTLGINAKLFKNVLNVMHTIVDDAAIKVYPDRIIITAVDPAHVCITEIEIPKRASDYFKNTGEFSQYGIDLDSFKHVLKSVKKDTFLMLGFTEEKIKISLDNMTMEIKTLDASNMSQPKIPNLNLPGHFTLPVMDIYEVTRQCSLVSDHITIGVIGETIFFNAKSEEIGNTNIKYDNDQTYSPMKSKFPLDYLLNHYKSLKTLDKNSKSSCDIGTDYPIRINTDLENGVNVLYLLAPRIDNDY